MTRVKQLCSGVARNLSLSCTIALGGTIGLSLPTAATCKLLFSGGKTSCCGESSLLRVIKFSGVIRLRLSRSKDLVVKFDMALEIASQTESAIQGAKKSLSSLEQALGARFGIWNLAPGGEFEPLDVPDNSSTDISVVLASLEQASQQQKTVLQSFAGDQCQLTAPWPAGHTTRLFVTTTVDDSQASLAAELLQVTIQGIKQQSEIQDLKEENAAYLMQLNEDMEELVFLRSIADKLALGDLSLNSEKLLQYILPALGESTGVEAVHFVDGRRGTTPEIVESWFCGNCPQRVDIDIVNLLAEDYCPNVQESPIVENNVQDREYGAKYEGVEGFAIVPVSTHLITFGWIVAINRKTEQSNKHQHPVWQLGNDELGTCEVSLMSTTAAMVASYSHNVTLFDEREALMLSVVRTLVSAIESRDQYTCGHSERVARYAKRLAKELGYDQEGCKQIYLTGLLHDIGKIGLPDSVLKKPGSLTKEEFAEIMKHPDLGWAILRELEPMEYVLPGVLHHHERADGKGYPDGLMRDNTPLEGRLLAVVDAFDAMTSDRPYRKGMPWEQAVSILLDGADSQWDAEVVDKFVAIMPDMLSIRDNYRRPPLPVRKPEEEQAESQALPKDENFDVSELLSAH